jgi:hypothetical protein
VSRGLAVGAGTGERFEAEDFPTWRAVLDLLLAYFDHR